MQAAKQIIPTEDWLKLLQSNADLYTSSDNFGLGDRDCWKLGHFGDAEIGSGYDARRPITNEVVSSLADNIRTLVYGRPFISTSDLPPHVDLQEYINTNLEEMNQDKAGFYLFESKPIPWATHQPIK